MPFPTEAWLTDNAEQVQPPAVRAFEGDHAYQWSLTTHASRWVLPITLREEGSFHLHRTLVLVLDEGSPGWATFNFLANHVRARVLFIRDPLHRMSNLFTNALRAAPCLALTVSTGF